jgi:hypothetical protein
MHRVTSESSLTLNQQQETCNAFPPFEDQSEESITLVFASSAFSTVNTPEVSQRIIGFDTDDSRFKGVAFAEEVEAQTFDMVDPSSVPSPEQLRPTLYIQANFFIRACVATVKNYLNQNSSP